MELQTLLNRIFKAYAEGKLKHLRSPIIVTANDGDGSCTVVKESAIQNGYEYKEITTKYIPYIDAVSMFHGMPKLNNGGEVEICQPTFFDNEKCVYNFVISKETESGFYRLLSYYIGSNDSKSTLVITCYDGTAENFDGTILCRSITLNYVAGMM